jgi:hypothetical protein
LAHAPWRCRQHVLAADAHFAGRRRHQPENAPARRRLAAARLADEAERLALLDPKADIVDGFDDRSGAE